MSMSTAFRRQEREILSGETIVLAECDNSSGSNRIQDSTVSNRCISFHGKALLRLNKISGSSGHQLRNNDIVQIECGFGLVLRGHSWSKYVSWSPVSDKNCPLTSELSIDYENPTTVTSLQSPAAVSGNKAAFFIEGIPSHTVLQSQMPFRLSSIYWPGKYLSKQIDSRPIIQSQMEDEEEQSQAPVQGCLVLAKIKKLGVTPMTFCSLPARLTFRQLPSRAPVIEPTNHIRDLFDTRIRGRPSRQRSQNQNQTRNRLVFFGTENNGFGSSSSSSSGLGVRPFLTSSSRQFAYITRFRTIRKQTRYLKVICMDRLDHFEVTAESKDEHKDDCTICLDSFNVGDRGCALPCDGKHQFHTQCIENWLKVKTTCPNCVSSMSQIVKRICATDSIKKNTNFNNPTMSPDLVERYSEPSQRGTMPMLT